MLRKVLWIAAACAAVLMALAVSRSLNFDKPPTSSEEAQPPAAVEVATPAPEPAPVTEAAAETAPPPPLTPDELQIQEDAAATGMTTVEPSTDAAPPY